MNCIVDRIEADRHERLLSRETYTPGVALDLRVNHGWNDPLKVEHSGPTVILIDAIDAAA